MDRGRQSVEDKTTIQEFLDEGVAISHEQPDKVRVLVDILQRIVDNGPRVRSGPTKAMLIQLRELIPKDFEVAGTSSKVDIVSEILEKLRQNVTEHPIGGKYAGTATFLPWNSHNPYAGTASASTAIPTSAKKNALEQP